MNRILELKGFRGNAGGSRGPTGEQGRRIEDSPFFKPPKTVMIGEMIAFVPEGLTDEQYWEWYGRMLSASHVVVGMRERNMTPEYVKMGVNVEKWFGNVIDRICKIVYRLWH